MRNCALGFVLRTPRNDSINRQRPISLSAKYAIVFL